MVTSSGAKQTQLPRQKMKEVRPRGKGKAVQWFGNSWKSLAAFLILMSRFTVNSSVFCSRIGKNLPSQGYMFIEMAGVPSIRVAAWEVVSWLLFCYTRQALQEFYCILKMIPHQDRPRRQGNSEERGRYLGEEKLGQNLIRSYTDIAISVTLLQIKLTVFYCRQSYFTIPSVNWLNFLLQPVVVVALLISLDFLIYYGQWESLCFWERSTESLREEATHAAHQNDVYLIVSSFCLLWTVAQHAKLQWKKYQVLNEID